MSRVTLTFDDALLRRIDEAAHKAGLSRSAYLARLAARELAEGPGRGASVDEALEALDQVFASVPSGAPSAAKAVRETRDEA